MRIFNVFIKARFLAVIFIIATSLLGTNSIAQQLQTSDFVLFGGSGVSISPYSKIDGGSIGSFSLIKAANSSTFNTNLYSGGNIAMADSNTIVGKIAAANSAGLKRGTILLTGSVNISGNIDVNGNIVIGSGTVAGKVTQPRGASYTGPVPSGGNVTGTPTLPALPSLPAAIKFPTVGATDITSGQVITPGAYGNIILRGKQTITLSGTGVYIFNSIQNSGGINNFVFDF